jgi:A/G-specific adenine glycosylase
LADGITTARAETLLAWYDAHARELPWRVGPAARRAGVRPDPYRVWLSEVMLQQTTVAAAAGHFLRLAARWPDVHALASAPREAVLGAWAGLGYYARARNLHACAQVVSRELGGRFPDTEEGLRALPGIGPYTAAAIAAIAFDRPAVVVDGNVERVMARFFAEEAPLPGGKPRLRELAARLTPRERPGDYAQAVMDLGATVCTASRPACLACPWRPDCRANALGVAEALPRRAPRAAKPVRHGIAWLAIDADGRVLTERRAEAGLLGGMLAVPGTEWVDEAHAEDSHPCEGGQLTESTPMFRSVPFRDSTPSPPLPGDWRPIGEVRHTFTHFHLRLEVRLLSMDCRGCAGFLPLTEAVAAMPTVFAKAVRLARGAVPADRPPDAPPTGRRRSTRARD